MLPLFNRAGLRANYCLWPLLGAVGFGCSLGIAKLIRDALYNPAVSFRPRANPEPWNSMVDEHGNTIRYKFSGGGPDYAAGETKYGIPAFPAERPPIEKWWREWKEEEEGRREEDH